MYYLIGYWLGVMSILISGESIVRALEHASNRNLPNELLPPNVAAEAVRRGKYDMGSFIDEALSDGFTEDKAAAFYALTEKLLSLGELINLRFRGELSEEEFLAKAAEAGFEANNAKLALTGSTPRLSPSAVVQLKQRALDGQIGIKDYYDELRDQGWSEERIASLQYLEYYLPSIGDIFQFAAWNVDDQAFVQSVGLDQGKPAAFYDYMAHLGVTKETADKLWAAHWQVPSVFIIKELFQTGQISEAQLKQMLQVYQISPAFIDSITRAFYKPLSEAELTNLLKEGLITADELPKRLLSTGISPADAALKAQEIIGKVNDPAAAAKTAKQAQKEQFTGLSVANVEQAYTDGIIDKPTALGYLKDLGEADDIANLHLALIDHKIAADQQKSDIQNITDQVTLGMVDVNDAITQLGALGLTAVQQQKILVKLVKQTKPKTAKPSKADLDAFVKAGLVDQTFYLQELAKLGYSDTYVALYSNEIALKINDATIWPLQQTPSVNPLPPTTQLPTQQSAPATKQ